MGIRSPCQNWQVAQILFPASIEVVRAMVDVPFFSAVRRTISPHFDIGISILYAKLLSRSTADCSGFECIKKDRSGQILTGAITKET